MNKTFSKAFMPVLMVFAILNALFFAFGPQLRQWQADQNLLLAGNSILFLITLLSFYLAVKGLQSKNTYAFIRSVYASILIKLFICLIAAFAYIASVKSHLNKPAFFTCMALYLLYTFVEVSVLMKLLKVKPNE